MGLSKWIFYKKKSNNLNKTKKMKIVKNILIQLDSDDIKKRSFKTS